jgi:hypothetical protein
MLPWLIAVIAVASLAGPPAASAGTISSDFHVTWAGTTTGADAPKPAAALGWSFNYTMGSETGGDRPATLTSATQATVTRTCIDSPDPGSITTSVNAVADPAASINVVPYVDVRRGVGSAVVQPSPRNSGMALASTDQECPDAPDNGVTTMPVPADSLVHGVTSPKRWPIHRTLTGAWVGGGTQTVSPGDIAGFAPQVQTVHVRLVGTLPTLNALCLMPSPLQLRFARTQRAALAYLASAGFPRPNTGSWPSRTVPAGRYFVLQQNAVDRYLGCGPHGVTLMRSTGPHH